MFETPTDRRMSDPEMSTTLFRYFEDVHLYYLNVVLNLTVSNENEMFTRITVQFVLITENLNKLPVTLY